MDARNMDQSPEHDFDSLKIYFDDVELANMSEYEKKRFAKIKRNYENLVNMGVNPAVPNFMLRKKRTDHAVCFGAEKSVNPTIPSFVFRKKKTSDAMCSGGNAEKSVHSTLPDFMHRKQSTKDAACSGAGAEESAAKTSKEVPKRTKVRYIDWRTLPWGDGKYERTDGDQGKIDICLGGVMKNMERLNQLREKNERKGQQEMGETRRRYPRRNVPKVCYEEEDVSSEDDYIYCDECYQPHNGSCPQHGPLVFVKDKKAEPGPRFAWNTCPDYLSVCRSGIRGAGLGIWTEKDLVKGFVFGPYKGTIVKARSEAKDSGYAWEIRKGGRILHYIEGSDTSISNWMRFVNCAMCEERQNLIAFQFRGQIYYRIYKEIKAFSELLVWYGDEFGKELGIYHDQQPLALEGKDKRPRNDRSYAPSSSIKMLKDIQQKLPRPTMKILNNHSMSYNIRSPPIPTNLKKCQISHKSEYLNGVISDLSTEVNLGDKSAIEKRNGIDSVADENAIPRRKHAVFSNKKKTDHELLACAQCDYTTGNSAVLRTHFDEVHDGKRPYKCQQCDYRASHACALRRHVKIVHEGLKTFKCQQCDYRASLAINLRKHVNAVHEGLKPYKCQQCDYRASQAIHLRNHVNAVHEGLKPYKCQQCDYRASLAIHLRNHVNAVHEGLKPYKCQQCDYRASQAIHLRNHVNAVHEGLKPYKCQQCDYRASLAINLRNHVNAVHEGLKPYKCQQCDYKTTQAAHLRYHVNEVHEGLKPYKCQQCDYRSSRAIILRNHVNVVHEGLKPYKCQQCDYRASRTIILRRHVSAAHEGVKPYSCKMCEYKTADSDNLRRHERAKHSVMNNTETPEVEK